ncbi:AbfB domain-containing protein [Streptomyces fulvoviolaceus]|uniref:AbfB domain-containing protein n=1 Tax=Streptomyces fulvoviolaceus TaxID=285535 RepID=UPI0004CAAA50|nr:AbfB domain-containing protein [Streptomyces fulvoviolaceus]MCT9080517.1 AbfB domain-containing protein [Streptomyces fulvoviolaceus]
MPESKSQPPQEHPWENGWTQDTSRTPGTRRLYLAGALAVATIVACVAAIAVTENDPDDPSGSPRNDGAGLISFASPSTATTPPPGKAGLASLPATTRAPGQHGSTPSATVTASAKPPKSSPSRSSSAKPKPTTTWRSVRSVNYPDRYWHVSDSTVRLDAPRGSESREDSTFKLVKGLANSSCYSFATHDGKYLRHRNFVLRTDRGDGSSVFKKDATFCPRSSSYSGAVTLESVNYPGYFLRHRDFVLRLERFEYSSLYQADSAFRLVGGLD